MWNLGSSGFSSPPSLTSIYVSVLRDEAKARALVLANRYHFSYNRKHYVYLALNLV